MGLAALVAVAAGLLSCGKKGDPLPPLRPIPAAAEALNVRQVGDRLRLKWKAPSRNDDGTTEAVSLREALVLRRVVDPPPPLPEPAPQTPETEVAPEEPAETPPPPVSPPPFESEAIVVGTFPSTVLGEALEHEEPVDSVWVGKRVEFAVRYVNRKNRESPLSEVVALEPSSAIGAPRELKAEAADGFVALSWTPPEDEAELSFSVFRKGEGGYPAAPLHSEPLTAPSYEDRSAVFGAPVCYAVAAGRAGVESLPSEEVCITPTDRFPPPVPAGLVAVASKDGVLLSWAEVEASDVRAYRVYRADSSSGPFQLLSEVPTSSYTDAGAAPGTTYFYAVTALDDSEVKNESKQSEPVEATRPP